MFLLFPTKAGEQLKKSRTALCRKGRALCFFRASFAAPLSLRGAAARFCRVQRTEKKNQLTIRMKIR